MYIIIAGGCKHAVALLGWLYRKTEEKPCTSVESYWKKPRLSKVGSTVRTANDLRSSQRKTRNHGLQSKKKEDAADFLSLGDVLQAAETNNSQCGLLKHYVQPEVTLTLSIHLLMRDFLLASNTKSAIDFIEFCKPRYTKELIDEIFTLTMDQSECPAWFRIKYGRIGASKLYETAHCKTSKGVLVESILGAKNKFISGPMKRGLQLEPQIIKILEFELNTELRRCGTLLHPDYPMFNASADALGEDFTVEIKSPSTVEAGVNYINDETGLPRPKFYAQMQLQMLFTNKKRGIFCLAHHNFEANKKIEHFEVPYDEEYLLGMMHNAMAFWMDNVYPILRG